MPAGDWLQFLDNGLTAGTVAVVLMTWLAELTSPRVRRLQARLSEDALPEIDSFLKDIAARNRWDDSARQRLRAVGEETLWSLMQTGDGDESQRRLTVVARPGSGMVELEFFSSLEGQNLQDRLAYLSHEAAQEDEASFRLLHHYAQSVRHQKYHGVDIVRVVVSGDSRHGEWA